MAVAVYKLRIRDDVGDDSRWQEARVVAPSLAEALLQAQQRFGEDRVISIERDAAAGEPPTAADLVDADAPEAGLHAAVVPEPLPDPQIVHAPIGADADAFVDAVIEADALPREPMREPMPWEGRWRPANLLRLGVAAGLVAFLGWYWFGAPASQRFVTAAPAATEKTSGLALGDAAPRGGVLAATGTPLHRGDDALALGTMVGESVADVMDGDEQTDEAATEDGADDPDVRTIGTLVGDMFSRWPNDNSRSVEAPPPYDDGASVGDARAALPPPPPMPSAPREPAVLQAYYVGVDRGGGIIETLKVPAYDADHARAIVSDLPERPIIVRGPTTRLDW